MVGVRYCLVSVIVAAFFCDIQSLNAITTTEMSVLLTKLGVLFSNNDKNLPSLLFWTELYNLGFEIVNKWKSKKASRK